MSIEIQRIFLHYFDIHFLRQKGIQYPYQQSQVIKECRLATRLALVFADEVIVPAASYFESKICKKIIDEHRDLWQLGNIVITGNANYLEHFREKKLLEYHKNSPQFEAYSKLNSRILSPPYVKRDASATSDISKFWIASGEKGEIFPKLRQSADSPLPKDFEKKWILVPDLLDDQAFIVDHVQELLGPITKQPTIQNFLLTIINQGYFSSFTKEFKAGIISDLVYLASKYPIESSEINLPYRDILRIISEQGLLDKLKSNQITFLLSAKNDPKWQVALEKALNSNKTIDGYEKKNSNIIYTKGRVFTSMKQLKTFIVHGHNGEILLELKNFLQNNLHLPEPIILDEKPSIGQTVIEKFESYTGGIDVAFVILSPDDTTLTGKTSKAKRARQNVIFELGYFYGKFGRKTGRTILLYKNPLEIPSDLIGVVYVDVTNGVMAKAEIIRHELEAI